MELQNARNQGVNLGFLTWPLFFPFGLVPAAMISDLFLSKENKKSTSYGERMIARAQGTCFPCVVSIISFLVFNKVFPSFFTQLGQVITNFN